MKKALSLIGIVCLLLAFAIPIFAGPLTIVQTPFWDSYPYTTSTNVGGDIHENPVRVGAYTPLEVFVVQGSHKLEEVEVHIKMCNYVQSELESLSSFPQTELRANLYNWTPAEGGDYKLPGERNIGTYHYDIKSQITTARDVRLTMAFPEYAPTVTSDPTVTHSMSFVLLGDGADIYDICIYRSQTDTTSGRGYYWGGGTDSTGWGVFDPGEGQDIAMRLYGTDVTPTPGNGDGDTGDGEDGDTDTGDGGNGNGSSRIPWITAILFALGIVFILLSMKILPLTLIGFIFIAVLFFILFAVWNYWLLWAWLGLFT